MYIKFNMFIIYIIMKIDYKHVLVFFLIFMIFQYILLISEWNSYLNMVSDIQGYKFNLYKNLENNFTFKNSIVFTMGYIVFIYFIYYYIILTKKSLLEGFLFSSFTAFMWDACIFCLFDKGVKYYPLLLYDTFIVVGVCMVISQYILYNYYDVLKKYIPLLFVFYISTMIWFFYKFYKYNPDLSNIKGIVIF